jgi:site-specific DNA recombinase
MEKKKENKKCYIYIRVSTSMQVEGYSLEAQRDRLTKFAEFEHMEIVREYCDAGKSGKSIAGRPEFTQMLQDVASDRDGVQYILVFKLSRFGRNAADVLNSLQYIQDYGVNLICVEDGIDSSRDSGKLTITVLSAVAEIERENILVQTMEGRRQKAREGKWNGGPAPFGYKLDKENDSLSIEPQDAEIVKLIFRMYANEGMGPEEICRYLNQHGYQKSRLRERENTHFVKSLIKTILANPVYTGKIAYGKSVTEKVKGTRDQYHRVKADSYLLAEGKHEAIIDDDLWLSAQARRKEASEKKTRVHKLEHEHILSGLIRCPVCGGGLVGTVRRRTDKKTGDSQEDFYYRCLHRIKIDGEHNCNYKFSLNQNEMNHRVEEIVLDMVNDSRFGEFIRERLERKVDVSELEKEREQVRNQLRQLEGARQKLGESLDKLDVNDRHYDRKYNDMQERMDNLYDRISDAEDIIEDVNDKITAAYGAHITGQQLYRLLEHFSRVYDKMTDLEKKEFFQNFIDYIEIYPDKKANERVLKRIHFRFPVFYNGQLGDTLWLRNENGVETCCAMHRRDA